MVSLPVLKQTKNKKQEEPGASCCARNKRSPQGMMDNVKKI